MGITEDFSSIIKQIESFIEKAEAAGPMQLPDPFQQPQNPFDQFKPKELTDAWYHSPKSICNPYDPQYFDPRNKAEHPPEGEQCYTGPQGGIFYCGIKGIGIPDPKRNNDILVTTHNARMATKTTTGEVSPQYQRSRVVFTNALKDKFHWIDWETTLDTLNSEAGYQKKDKEGNPIGRKIHFEDFLWPKPMGSKEEYKKFLMKNLPIADGTKRKRYAEKIAGQKENLTRFHTHLVGKNRSGNNVYKAHQVGIQHRDAEAWWARDNEWITDEKDPDKIKSKTQFVNELIRLDHEKEREKYSKDFMESIERNPYDYSGGDLEGDKSSATEDCINKMASIKEVRRYILRVGQAIGNPDYMKTVEQRRKGYGLINKLVEARKEAIRLGNDENKGYLNEEEIKKFLHLKNTLDINPNKSDNEIKQDIKEDNEAIKNKEFPKYGDVKEFNGISLAGGGKNEAEKELNDAGKLNEAKREAQLRGEDEEDEDVEDEKDENINWEKPIEEAKPPVVERKKAVSWRGALTPPVAIDIIHTPEEVKNVIGPEWGSIRNVTHYTFKNGAAKGKQIYVARKKADIGLEASEGYVVYDGKKTQFKTQKEAEKELQRIVDEAEGKENKSINKKSFNIEKQGLLNRIESLVNAPMPNPALPVENEINGFKVFSQFQSGANKVTLEGKDNEYKVCTNGIESTKTNDFREALAKYYSSVSRIIDTQSEDKDLGLEMFGEHVLNTARKTRKLMADLDKSYEATMLESLDYGEIEIPFNPDFILKYEPDPIIKADPTGDFFGIVPITNNSEDTQCEAEYGDKIGKKDLKEDEYHKKDRNRDKKQEAITEDTADGIQPVIITNSLNQPQMLPTRQEENLRNEPIEKPYRVNGIARQRNLHPEQNRVNEGNRGVDGG